jgi:hypothetical protein
MKKVLLWTGVIVLAAILGAGTAYAFTARAQVIERAGQEFGGYAMMGQGLGAYGYGMMDQDEYGYGRGYGRMGQGPGVYGYGMMGESWGATDSNAPRLSLEQALDAANAYAGDDFDAREIMEFEANFYVLFVEPETGRGAFEVLIDPVSGAVSPEPGPNMMWNRKYGHMGGFGGDNTLEPDEARQIAQQSLDARWDNAEVEGEGTAFYGYYTFDYAVDGVMTGMFSVNGTTGDVFYHTWHGTFIQEEEYE